MFGRGEKERMAAGSGGHRRRREIATRSTAAGARTSTHPGLLRPDGPPDDAIDLGEAPNAVRRIARRSLPVLAVVCLASLLFVAHAAAQSGDADRGKDLFRGTERLDNGGPPCMACHSAGGLGALGGGVLAPDLSGYPTSAILPEDGSSGVLSTLPFPTMQPVFEDRPITPDEQADVAAFLREAGVAERASGAAIILFGLAAAAAIVLFALAGLLWRQRLHGVRKPMVDQSRVDS